MVEEQEVLRFGRVGEENTRHFVPCWIGALRVCVCREQQFATGFDEQQSNA